MEEMASSKEGGIETELARIVQWSLQILNI